MSERMWRLDQFRFDEQITAEEVSVFDETTGELVTMGRDDAIALAHGRGVNLVEWWPVPADDPMPSCILSKVTRPLRWETVSVVDADKPIDERLWFEASCGGRDFLLDGGLVRTLGHLCGLRVRAAPRHRRRPLRRAHLVRVVAPGPRGRLPFHGCSARVRLASHRVVQRSDQGER